PGPVAGARVEIYRHEPAESYRLAYGLWFAAPPVASRMATTDAGGSFAFMDLPPAVYRLRVLHPDHADWLSAPVPVPLEGPLPCALLRPACLRGTVLGAGERPQAGIPLVLTAPDHPFSRFTRSDEEGKYEIRNLAPG